MQRGPPSEGGGRIAKPGAGMADAEQPDRHSLGVDQGLDHPPLRAVELGARVGDFPALDGRPAAADGAGELRLRQAKPPPQHANAGPPPFRQRLRLRQDSHHKPPLWSLYQMMHRSARPNHSTMARKMPYATIRRFPGKGPCLEPSETSVDYNYASHGSPNYGRRPGFRHFP